MNQEKINRDLAENTQGSSRLQKFLTDRIRSYMTASAGAMHQYWAQWEATEDIYRAWRVLDKEDNESKSKGNTPKLIIPVTYAQTQTFCSFMLSAYTQRDNFYELHGAGPEDQSTVEGIQRDLQYQLDKNTWSLTLFQAVLNACKYGFFTLKTQWTTEHENVRASREVRKEPNMFASLLGKMTGRPVLGTVVTEEYVGKMLAYEGNRISVVSPYTFYPDPNFPISEFQKGEFVGNEEEVSLTRIRSQEGKLYYGTDKIKEGFSAELWGSRKRRVGMLSSKNSSLGSGVYTIKGNAILTEVFFYCSPSEMSKKTGFDLGQEKDPVLFIATLANDDKIIRFERSGYLFQGFPYAVGEYSPDNNTFVNPGLNDTISDLQNLVTWFINSHVLNVQKVLKSRFIVDETKVRIEDIDGTSPYIRVNKSTSDIDKVIKQLSVADVTQSHIGDVNNLMSLIQLTTGINDNALGQYASGRRSATEARNVNSGAAARLQMHAKLLYEGGFCQFGRILVANTRQGRSLEVYNRILGNASQKYPFERTILAEPEQILGGYDFMPFDATLPSGRYDQASLLKEIFTMLVNNPQTIQMLQLNPVLILDHIAELLGIDNMKDFSTTSQQGQAPQPMQQLPQPQVVPDEQAMNMAQGGQPVGMMGENLIAALQQGQGQ